VVEQSLRVMRVRLPVIMKKHHRARVHVQLATSRAIDASSVKLNQPISGSLFYVRLIRVHHQCWVDER